MLNFQIITVLVMITIVMKKLKSWPVQRTGKYNTFIAAL
jgi:hypothetical protein